MDDNHYKQRVALGFLVPTSLGIAAGLGVKSGGYCLASYFPEYTQTLHGIIDIASTTPSIGGLVLGYGFYTTTKQLKKVLDYTSTRYRINGGMKIQ